MKQVLKIMGVNLILVFIFTPLILKACDREYDYQQAKYKKWEKERKENKPFTDFNE